MKMSQQEKSILAAVPVGIVRIDLQGNIIYANPAYHEMFGYDDGKLIGTSIPNRMESGEKRRSMVDFLAMLRKDQPIPTPYFQSTHTTAGKSIEVQAEFTYDRDREGNLVTFTYAIKDITERKQTELALRKSRALLDTYIAMAPVAMGFCDTVMRYVNLNQALADINGLSIEEHIGKRPSDILPR